MRDRTTRIVIGGTRVVLLVHDYAIKITMTRIGRLPIRAFPIFISKIRSGEDLSVTQGISSAGSQSLFQVIKKIPILFFRQFDSAYSGWQCNRRESSRWKKHKPANAVRVRPFLFGFILVQDRVEPVEKLPKGRIVYASVGAEGGLTDDRPANWGYVHENGIKVKKWIDYAAPGDPWEVSDC